MSNPQDDYYDVDLLKLGYEGERAITAELYQKYGKAYPAKSIIIREGEQGNEVYLIITGRVVVCEKLKTGTYKVLASLGPGEIFGEMAALEDDQTRSATIISGGEVKLLKLVHDDFNFIMKTHPRWAFKLLSSIAGRILNTFEQISEHYRNSMHT